MPSNILLPRADRALREFVRPGTLIAFDFDGVLAPIVSTRSRAHLRQQTRRLVVALASRMPCIVVSGRRFADVVAKLEGVPLRQVYGNFGSEPSCEGDSAPTIVRGWVRMLRAALRGHAGIVVEDKRFSVAVHYRAASDARQARAVVVRALARLPGNGRMLDGTMAMMLVPACAPTKGTTLQRARRELGCTRAIYIGDDGTDEDAFRSAAPSRLLSIRVGRGRATRASYVLPAQHQIDTLLARIIERHDLTVGTPCSSGV